jgi:hypothetical protein
MKSPFVSVLTAVNRSALDRALRALFQNGD